MDRIERAVAKTLYPVLQPYGFELKRDWGVFVRHNSRGFDSLHVVNKGTATGGGKFSEIACYAAIRHDRIENPWNTLGLVYGEDAQAQTWTLLYKGRVELPLLKVASESMDTDVAHVADEVRRFFDQSALPFYERFRDLSAVETWVNAVPLSYKNPAAGGPMEHLAMRALLLAKAVNPQRYALVREAFITLNKGMFPREKRIQLLKYVDEMDEI